MSMIDSYSPLRPFGEYPVGTIVEIKPPPDTVGVWKMMDGVENFHPGSAIDYRFMGASKTSFFERVA